MNCPRILVVDDEPDVELLVRQSFRKAIKNKECAFEFAQDGIDALEKLDANPDIHIVFTDINMPRMDGLKLLETLQQLENTPTTVIVSAYSDQKNIRTAMNNGAFDFITKPIEFEDFSATLDKSVKHTSELAQLTEEREAAQRNEAMLRRYFSPGVAEAMAADPDAVLLKGQRRVVTQMFTDLADFLPLVDSTAPDEVIDVLNVYLDKMTGIIFEHNGTLMKIIGDALHAMFGAPEEDPDHAQKAVACAMALDEFATAYKAEVNARGIPLGDTRIGINTGEAVIGNFGGKRFLDYRAYGTSVNMAARLETANKKLGTRICVSGNTVDMIDGFIGRPVGNLLLKGSTEPMKAFEPLTEKEANSAHTKMYIEAYDLIAKGDPKARQAMAELVGKKSDDTLGSYHLARILSGTLDLNLEI